MEHELKDIAFYVQKHIAPWTVVITFLLVRDKPLGAPAFVKRVYCYYTCNSRGHKYVFTRISKIKMLSTLPIIMFSVVVCLRGLLHHILSLIAYTFRENRDFVFIIIVQFMMSANIRIRFGLQIVSVCLYITPSHYHHCANLSEEIELIKCCQIYFVECVNKIKHIFSVIHYTIYGSVCFQFTHFPCDDWENIHFVLLSSSNRKYELLSIV